MQTDNLKIKTVIPLQLVTYLFLLLSYKYIVLQNDAPPSRFFGVLLLFTKMRFRLIFFSVRFSTILRSEIR